MSQTGYLAMLCYNFGLDVFQKGEYQHSVTWLKWVATHPMFPYNYCALHVLLQITMMSHLITIYGMLTNLKLANSGNL